MIIIVFSPYLLVIDFKRYSPFVLMIWFLSFAYYLWLKRSVDRLIQMKQKDEREDSNNEHNEEKKK